jgi:hypothetical protein
MPPVLFHFVIQALLDTLNIEAQPIKFTYFPENKMEISTSVKADYLAKT